MLSTDFKLGQRGSSVTRDRISVVVRICGDPRWRRRSHSRRRRRRRSLLPRTLAFLFSLSIEISLYLRLHSLVKMSRLSFGIWYHQHSYVNSLVLVVSPHLSELQVDTFDNKKWTLIIIVNLIVWLNYLTIIPNLCCMWLQSIYNVFY